MDGRNISIEFDKSLHSRVAAKFDGEEAVLGELSPSEYIVVDGKEIKDFTLSGRTSEEVQDPLGAGRKVTMTGAAGAIEKTLAVTVYEDFPRMAFFDVSYRNTGSADLNVEGWTNQHYSITPSAGDTDPALWSFQSGSYENRPTWIVPVKAGFEQDNYMGMNADDYGGGTPVSDVWRRDVGIGVGHIEVVPKLVSVPVNMPGEGAATVAVTYKKNQTLKPGDSLETFRTFAAVHQKDYFQTLQDYSQVMGKRGITIDPSPESAFEPIWCAWGYGRDFTMDQVYGALPIVKRLGFTWVTMDDGFQTAEGDWFLRPEKYPNGDQDMKRFVDRIHQEGFKAQIWWAPLAVDPDTTLINEHPEQLLLNEDGSKQKISWWNSWYLCPADKDVIEYHKNLVVKMMRDWGYDGLKLDGQHMNQVPPCYNPEHHHARPEDSVEMLPQFFKMIYDTARSIKKDAVVEFCPCGDAFSFFMLPYTNMTVASDPEGSIQIRTKGKSLKALHGDKVAYFGDHVELTTDAESFASIVGVGATLGTNFTWPAGSHKPKREGRNRNELNPEMEALFTKWMGIYKEKMLPKGEYMGGLYDLGFDTPETHAIRRENNMYYSFYAPQFNGKIELRGLGDRSYRVTDYVSGKDFGAVQGPTATIDGDFKLYLLLEAKPE
ncbi:MAG: glycoside hydrolase family 36 protein [Bryobacterales bacterium]